MAINFHYCNGHLTKISVLGLGGHENCGCSPEGVPKGCCKDHLHYVKAENHKALQAVSVVELISTAAELHISNTNTLVRSIEDPESSYNSIQRSYPHPIFLLNRVFRI